MANPTKLYSYLVFDGSAKQAMDFYAQAFGGKCTYNYFSEAPEESTGGPLNETDKQRVMHGCMTVGDHSSPFLMASDTFPGSPEKLVVGNNYSVSVHTNDIVLLEKIFNSLSEGGIVKMPFAETFWAARFGMLTDKFGVNWMFNAMHNTSSDAFSNAVRLYSYLVFDGNCKQSLDFYSHVFNGKCTLSPFGEAPDDSTGGQLSDDDKQRIMHGCLTIGDHSSPFLMASDTFPGSPEKLVQGNSYSISINSTASEADIVQLEKQFNALSEGGVIKMPFAETFWATRYGMCTDKFGVHWMFNALNCSAIPTADATAASTSN